MKIVDYSQTSTANRRQHFSLGEAVTAALIFLVPALVLFVLAH